MPFQITFSQADGCALVLPSEGGTWDFLRLALARGCRVKLLIHTNRSASISVVMKRMPEIKTRADARIADESAFLRTMTAGVAVTPQSIQEKVCA